MVQSGRTQIEACDFFTVDSRELRDFISYRLGETREITNLEQSIINSAAIDYVLDSGSESFTSYLEASARVFGVNSRQIKELWEVCPNYYPNNIER